MLSLVGAKSATGLMEWADIEISLEAFVFANHQTMFSQSKDMRIEFGYTKS